MTDHPMSPERVVAEFRACRDAGHMLLPTFMEGDLMPQVLTCQDPDCGRTTDHPQMLRLVERREHGRIFIRWPTSA